MFHILLLNKQRAPRNNICSQSELTLPSAPPCQPDPLHAAPGAQGPPPPPPLPPLQPCCCGGEQDCEHHTGRGGGVGGGQDVSTLLPGNRLIHLIGSKVKKTRVEAEHKHDTVAFQRWPVNDPFKGADRAQVNKPRRWERGHQDVNGHVSMSADVSFCPLTPPFSDPLLSLLAPSLSS